MTPDWQISKPTRSYKCAIMDAMKPHAVMHEGPEAFTRFQNAMKAVLAVPHAEIQRRIAEHRKEVDANPNRRGPKRKNASRVPPAQPPV